MVIIQPKIDNRLPSEMVFYCKDCHQIVETTPVGRKFAYTCNICKTKNVAFGTLKSIKSFYRIKDGISAAESVQEEKKRLQQELG